MKTRKYMNLTTRMGFALCALLMVLGLSLNVAAESFGEDWAVQSLNGQMVFVAGFIGAILIGILHYGVGINFAESTWGILVSVGAVIALVVPLTFGALYAMEEPVEPPTTTPPPVQNVRWLVQGAADLDVAGNTYPKAPFTDCDTSAGGTTAEWSAADNGNVDDTNRKATVTVHVDTDLDDAVALWMEPNCIFIEFSLIKLLDGPKASSGAIETQQYYGRIDSLQWTVPNVAYDNDTDVKQVFYADTNGRHHIGWEDEAENWLEACGEWRSKSLTNGASCDAVPLGNDNTAGDAVGAIGTAGNRLFWIWEDRGPFNWYAQNGDTWSLTFSVGSEGDWHTFTFTAFYTESATDNA